MIKVKKGAIIKEVPKGSLQWYIAARWVIISETNTEKTTSKRSKIQKKSK